MLVSLKQKEACLAIGLMSGTSADGVDVALVRIEGGGGESEFQIVAHDTLKYSAAVRERILACQGPGLGSARDIALLDSYVGELFAHAVLHICKKAGVQVEEVDLVGSHGQTLYHHPDGAKLPGFTVTGTLQVGRPAIIAQRTGLTVVSDFRSRDMAAGGQGSPLAPYFDYILYRHRARGRIAVNIGGVANLTGIPADVPIEKIAAFDTGPGNHLIDLAVTLYSKGQLTFDRNGAWAKAGKADLGLLSKLLEHPYVKQPPPKSLDKEVFGKAFLDKVIAENASIAPADMVATLTAFTVKSITTSIMEFLLQTERYEEIIVSGGGALNPVILDGLRETFPGKVISTSDDYAVPSKAKEAVMVAFLAHETVLGHSGNVPSATGASAPVVLGSITPGLRAFEDPEPPGPG